MDDLKVPNSEKKQLEKLPRIVEEFSKDSGMLFGLEKCYTLNGQIP